MKKEFTISGIKQKIYFALLFTLLVCLISTDLFSQTEAQRTQIKSKTNVAALEQMSLDYGNYASQRKAIAEEWAIAHGFPLSGVNANGQEFFIYDLDSISGTPLYVATTNLNSAATISTSTLWNTGSSGLNLSGAGISIAIWEVGLVCDQHPEYITRALPGIHEVLPSTAPSPHATHVAGTLIASGLDPNAHGMAPAANVAYYNLDDWPAEIPLEGADGTILSNNSWANLNQGWAFTGTDWYYNSNPAYPEYEYFGFYTTWTKMFDQWTNSAPYYLIVRGAGNDRGYGPPAGTVHYHWTGSTWVGGFTDFHAIHGGTGGFDCMDQYACAKNVLTVGAVADIPTGYSLPSDVLLAGFSNTGPTDDGRIKPDVVANGVSLYSAFNNNSGSDCSTLDYTNLTGTSMATPSVTGSAALLQEHYSNTHSSSLMLAATVKALIIETADESGTSDGPDYHFGWGLMNTEKAAEIITKDQSEPSAIQELTLTNGQTLDIPFTLSNPNYCYFSVTIVWNDPAGTPPSASLDPPNLMLVNDLDLRIIDPFASTYFPWRLDPTNPANPAIQTADNFRDNVEQVRIYSAASGTYTIRITHKGALASPQDFSIIINAIPTNDLYIRDSPDDVGNEPNAEGLASMGVNFWSSPDIWIRQANDGLVNQVSEPIEYTAGVPNYVYVRVKNASCYPQSGNLRVYWSNAGTGLGWAGDWVSNTTTYPGCTATIYGDEITPSASITVPSQSEQIYVFPWQPNNPDDYGCFTDPFHFCLLARIETSSTTPYGMTFPEGSGVWSNTVDNNSIAWKNVIINNAVAGLAKPWGTVIIRNVEEKTNYIKLNFVSKQDDIGQDLSKFKRIRLYFSTDFLKRWAEGGKLGKDVVMINDSVIEITSPNATMEHIFLRYNEIGSVSLSLKTIKEPVLSADQYFNFDIVQYTEGASIPQGGQTYMIKKGNSDEGCFTSTNILSGTIIGTQVFNHDTLLITGNVIVPAGAILKLKNLTVMIAENVKIKVQPGGVLTLNNAELLSACSGKKWTGIIVNGNNIISTTDLNIKFSSISGTDNPVTIDHVNGMKIIETAFIGDNLGTAITMTKMKDFTISKNTFKNYEIGILSAKTNQGDVKSEIEKNIFENVKVALQFKADNHSKLDIKCNRFTYVDYAILSDSTNLKDQGILGEGAGNEFISSSTLPNNKLKHTNGNAAKYYYDPNHPITSGMNITTLSSTLDRTCYVYSFDTSSTSGSHRMDPLSPVEESINKKIMEVYSIPNPNSGDATIYFSLGEEKQGELIIMDIYGKVLDRISINSESNKVDVNYNQFANGIYMISLINARGEKLTKKMTISK